MPFSEVARTLFVPGTARPLTRVEVRKDVREIADLARSNKEAEFEVNGRPSRNARSLAARSLAAKPPEPRRFQRAGSASPPPLPVPPPATRAGGRRSSPPVKAGAQGGAGAVESDDGGKSEPEPDMREFMANARAVLQCERQLELLEAQREALSRARSVQVDEYGQQRNEWAITLAAVQAACLREVAALAEACAAATMLGDVSLLLKARKRRVSALQADVQPTKKARCPKPKAGADAPAPVVDDCAQAEEAVALVSRLQRAFAVRFAEGAPDARPPQLKAEADAPPLPEADAPRADAPQGARADAQADALIDASAAAGSEDGAPAPADRNNVAAVKARDARGEDGSSEDALEPTAQPPAAKVEASENGDAPANGASADAPMPDAAPAVDDGAARPKTVEAALAELPANKGDVMDVGDDGAVAVSPEEEDEEEADEDMDEDLDDDIDADDDADEARASRADAERAVAVADDDDASLGRADTPAAAAARDEAAATDSVAGDDATGECHARSPSPHSSTSSQRRAAEAKEEPAESVAVAAVAQRHKTRAGSGRSRARTCSDAAGPAAGADGGATYTILRSQFGPPYGVPLLLSPLGRYNDRTVAAQATACNAASVDVEAFERCEAAHFEALALKGRLQQLAATLALRADTRNDLTTILRECDRGRAAAKRRLSAAAAELREAQQALAAAQATAAAQVAVAA
ncbi:hypothetical protein M885DRAFT_507094 [Pelagophyceae sp. CCMP2097]|nr:hypothetical protein M885DRAFT_507094 [Pelagophyceae sp. CCMP2097]